DRPEPGREGNTAAASQAAAAAAQPEEAARLLNDVWQEDEEFGIYLWAAMTTGARRGELLALRESRFDFEAQQVSFATSYVVRSGQRIEKETKTGESRRVSLDPLTC